MSEAVQITPVEYERATLSLVAPETQASESQPPVIPPIQVAPTAANQLSYGDVFHHWRGGPRDPQHKRMLPDVWRTHAAGYLRTGLAKEAAINEDGMLSDVIDKSRHLTKGIEYYLAFDPAKNDDPSQPTEMSTARLIQSRSIDELPTMSLTGEGIDATGRERLEAAARNGSQILEFGGLANALPGYCRGASEIIRRVLANTVSTSDRPQQVLFSSMVERTWRGLTLTLTEDNLSPIGQPTVLDENEYRKETTLIPVVIEPDMFVTNIFKASQRAAQEGRGGMHDRLLHSAFYFAEVLPPEFIPNEMIALRAQQGRSMMHAVDGGNN